MAYKLLVMDLDGTLTNTQKVITPQTMKALTAAQEAGVRLVLASGRPTYGIMPLVKQLDMARHGGFVLSYNGGNIIDCQSGETIFRQELPHNMVEPLYQATKSRGVTILTYGNNAILTEDADDPYIAIEAKINNMPIQHVDNFVEAVSHPITKCLGTAEPNRLAVVEKEMQQQFGSQLSIYRSAPYFLEIVAPGIDKAQSLQRLLGHLHLTKEEMITCGDGFNDLSMIRYAGLGVAMGNAETEVKRNADFVTLGNDEDGIAYVVRKFILGHNTLRLAMHRSYWRLKWRAHKAEKQLSA